MDIENTLIKSLQPARPELLKEFSVEITEEWEVENAGVGFSAIVYGSDNSSMAVENDGNGGCNRYLTFDTHGEDLLERFSEASKKAYSAETLDPMDMATCWVELRDLTDDRLLQIIKSKL